MIPRQDMTLEPADAVRLTTLCGEDNAHLRQIEDAFGVRISQRGADFQISGDGVEQAAEVLSALYEETRYQSTTAEAVRLAVMQALEPAVGTAVIRTRLKTVHGRGHNQTRYLAALARADLVMGIGPAGTGKTYLAVACALAALDQGQVRRLVLTRPAVEAGERLGFLPGDMAQKVDPYLRPLYDALYDMCGAEHTLKLIERQAIEIAPLAFMRGRTFNDAFVILDEGQNTTPEQMKMFLTRMGFGSRMAVTGDLSQVDLPTGRMSGLAHAAHILHGVSGVEQVWFGAQDVVRHHLVQRVVEAYAASESNG